MFIFSMRKKRTNAEGIPLGKTHRDLVDTVFMLPLIIQLLSVLE
jgi:hypothetical protein